MKFFEYKTGRNIAHNHHLEPSDIANMTSKLKTHRSSLYRLHVFRFFQSYFTYKNSSIKN